MKLERCDLLSYCIFDILIKTVSAAAQGVLCCDLLSYCIFDILIKTEIMTTKIEN